MRKRFFFFFPPPPPQITVWCGDPAGRLRSEDRIHRATVTAAPGLAVTALQEPDARLMGEGLPHAVKLRLDERAN